MKTFKDLVFELKYSGKELEYFKKYNGQPLPQQAVLHFDNGYGVSVITGFGSYSSKTKPYELAVLFEGNLTYNTPITDDVIGYLTKNKVTRLMKKIQEL